MVIRNAGIPFPSIEVGNLSLSPQRVPRHIPVSNAFPILLYRYSNTASLHSYSHVFGTD
jgi:hypothetical protein